MPENDQEWYTVHELETMYHVPNRSLYTPLSMLRKAQSIQTMENPADKRSFLVHRSALETIALIASDIKTRPVQRRPSIPHRIAHTDDRLITIEKAIEQYQVTRPWIDKNLTRLKFTGLSDSVYVYIPELEYEIGQPEIIPPGE